MGGPRGAGERGFSTHFQNVLLVGMHRQWSDLSADDVSQVDVYVDDL